MADSSQTPDSQDVERLAKAQRQTVRAAQRELNKVFDTVYNMYDDPADIRDALMDLIPAIANKYGNVGSQAAAEWYDRMREKWFSDDWQAKDDTVYTPDEKAMRATIRRLAGHLWSDEENGVEADPDAMLRGLRANMDKWVKAGGRATIRRAVKKDPRRPRFARVPQGATTCAFCAMLAGRGFVYSSAEAAGEMSKYHTDCDCEAIPSWDRKNPKIEGYDDKAYERRFMEARRMLENHTVPKDLMDGLLQIKPYREPKHKKSWYGPEDPNNVNSITYLMRHLHPDEFVDRVERDDIVPEADPQSAVVAETFKMSNNPSERNIISLKGQHHVIDQEWERRQMKAGVPLGIDHLHPHEIVFVESMKAKGQTVRWIPRDDTGHTPNNDFFWTDKGFETELKSLSSATYRAVSKRVSGAVKSAKENHDFTKDTFVIDFGTDFIVPDKLLNQLRRYNKQNQWKIRRLFVFDGNGEHEIKLE